MVGQPGAFVIFLVLSETSSRIQYNQAKWATKEKICLGRLGLKQTMRKTSCT